MGGSASAPEPPDTSQYSDQAAHDSNRMRTWAQSMWDSGQEEWGRLQEYSGQVMGASLPAMEEAFSWASAQRDRYEQNVLPQIQSLFSEAETYASKGEQDRQRGMAVQDVKASTEAQREAQLRKLEGYGVDPSDTRYQALDKQAGIAEGALSALAANQAGERTKQIGRDLRAQAINVGTGFLTDASQNAALGANIGAQSLGAAGGAAQTGANVAQGAIPYMGGAQAANAQAAGIVDTGYGRELDYAADQRAASAQDFSQMMAVGNMAGGMIPGVAEGGPVQVLNTIGYDDGGMVHGPGGPTDDAGAIRISDGEYVIPADVVMRVGSNHFDKLIEKETGRPPPSMKSALPVGGS